MIDLKSIFEKRYKVYNFGQIVDNDLMFKELEYKSLPIYPINDLIGKNFIDVHFSANFKLRVIQLNKGSYYLMFVRVRINGQIFNYLPIGIFSSFLQVSKALNKGKDYLINTHLKYRNPIIIANVYSYTGEKLGDCIRKKDIDNNLIYLISPLKEAKECKSMKFGNKSKKLLKSGLRKDTNSQIKIKPY